MNESNSYVKRPTDWVGTVSGGDNLLITSLHQGWKYVLKHQAFKQALKKEMQYGLPYKLYHVVVDFSLVILQDCARFFAGQNDIIF
ncbi:hypothetical protein Leryth_017456 [Lithospermum erythrorhizon]|nr:hypothetical protein Leryth_017456 [Lithospermum erythrorhizon]